MKGARQKAPSFMSFVVTSERQEAVVPFLERVTALVREAGLVLVTATPITWHRRTDEERLKRYSLTSGEVCAPQRSWLNGMFVKFGTFAGQLSGNELSTSDGNQLSFCKRIPHLFSQGNACEQRNELTGALDRKPRRHDARLTASTIFLEQHETWGLHPAGVGMLAPMPVSEKKIAIGIQEICRSQFPEFLGKRRHDQESLAEGRYCIRRRPDRRHPVEQSTKGEFGVGLADWVEAICLEGARFEYAWKVTVVCK